MHLRRIAHTRFAERYGARGWIRTSTALRPGDFRTTSAFAAPCGFVVWSTPSPWSRDFRRPPSALYTFPRLQGLARRWLERQLRAFTEFDGLHRVAFSAR